MNVVVTLKQLRRDPREYIRLLKNGYEVEITEHRKTVVKAIQVSDNSVKKAGNILNLLRTVEETPAVELVDPMLDTVAAVKKARREQVQNKYV